MALTFVQDFSNQSAKWYADLVDHLPIGICRTTISGRIIFCNRGLVALLGYDNYRDLVDSPIYRHLKEKKTQEGLWERIIDLGGIKDHPVLLSVRDGSSRWCALTVHMQKGRDGGWSHLDMILREISREGREENWPAKNVELLSISKAFVVILDLDGVILDINDSGAQLLNFKRGEIIGKPLFDFMIPGYRDPMALFLAVLLRTGREEGILKIMDREGGEHLLEFQALLVRKKDDHSQIELIARDVTARSRTQRMEMSQERFMGVMEMAGGVAHRLNQPLTIVNNLISEVLSNWEKRDLNYGRLLKVQDQIKVMNALAKKIGGIKKYEAMEYVAGVRIVDLDKASLEPGGE